MIQTQSLTKVYNGVAAVSNLDIHIQRGEIYGFLGPNGAGKTTTIMMILGLVKPTSGEVKLLGKKMSEDYFGIRRRMGVLSEFQYLYEDMTAGEYLRFFADLYSVEHPEKRIDQLLDLVDLRNRKDDLVYAYSKGMKQKLGLARVLVHDPELLILDEPVTGLDPHGIKEVRDIILEQNRLGKTVFLSSHILSEIERTCHRVGIMNKGTLVAEDDMANLKRTLSDEIELVVELESQLPGLEESLKGMEFVKSVQERGTTLIIKTTTEGDHRAEISRTIAAKGGVVLGMKVKEMTLEDAFVTITESNISLLAKEGAA